MTTMSEESEPAQQDPTEPFVKLESEQQQPSPEGEPQVEEQNVPVNETLRRFTRARKSVIFTDYKVNITETVLMEGDPTSYEEAMRSHGSSKWVETMEDEMESMSANGVWDLENILKGAKTVGCKWLYTIKYDSSGNVEK
jgi:hypothetical protein